MSKRNTNRFRASQEDATEAQNSKGKIRELKPTRCTNAQEPAQPKIICLTEIY